MLPLLRQIAPPPRGILAAAPAPTADHADASTAVDSPIERDGERGAVAAQVVIAMLVLVFVTLGIVQVALAAYANHVAQGAAEQALDAARVLGGTSADGQVEADQVLAQLATGPLLDPHVSVTRTATTVTVTITGRAERIWLGPSLPVRASATGVVERFAAP